MHEVYHNITNRPIYTHLFTSREMMCPTSMKMVALNVVAGLNGHLVFRWFLICFPACGNKIAC